MPNSTLFVHKTNVFCCFTDLRLSSALYLCVPFAKIYHCMNIIYVHTFDRIVYCNDDLSFNFIARIDFILYSMNISKYY